MLGVFVFLLCDLSKTGNAQSTFGSIAGTVVHASGATVTGASITVKNTTDNTTRVAVSNDAGEYEALNLRPGSYEIVAAKEGFATATITGATLEARQQLRED